MLKWSVYVVTLGFAVYWASNLLLWFPWSYSPVLGMTLMLTVAPFLWAYVTFLCLRSYPGRNPLGGAAKVAVILALLAVSMDYVFFGLIRNAMEQLYHPTTFYAYAFLISLPFLVGLLFKNRIRRDKRAPSNDDFAMAGISGMIFFGVLTLIIVLGIEV